VVTGQVGNLTLTVPTSAVDLVMPSGVQRFPLAGGQRFPLAKCLKDQESEYQDDCGVVAPVSAVHRHSSGSSPLAR